MVSEYVLSAGERTGEIYLLGGSAGSVGRSRIQKYRIHRIQKPRYSLTEKYFWVILLRDTLVGGIRTNIQCLKEKRGEK